MALSAESQNLIEKSTTEKLLDLLTATCAEDIKKGMTTTSIKSRLMNNGASHTMAEMICRIAVIESQNK